MLILFCIFELKCRPWWNQSAYCLFWKTNAMVRQHNRFKSVRKFKFCLLIFWIFFLETVWVWFSGGIYFWYGFQLSVLGLTHFQQKSIILAYGTNETVLHRSICCIHHLTIPARIYRSTVASWATTKWIGFCERNNLVLVWDLVKTHLCDSADSVIIADDSVQDKRYSKFIELVKKTV